MGPNWVLSAPDGPHVGPTNLAIRDTLSAINSLRPSGTIWHQTSSSRLVQIMACRLSEFPGQNNFIDFILTHSNIQQSHLHLTLESSASFNKHIRKPFHFRNLRNLRYKWHAIKNTIPHDRHALSLHCRGGSNKANFIYSQDDVIKWKHFPRNWPFVRGIHRSRLIPHTKVSEAELWSFLWSASE